MSGGKVVWLIWCLAWAVFWVTLGWLVLPLINMVLFVLSLAAAAPSFIGNERTELCPICGGNYPATNMAVHMSYRHGTNQALPPAR